MTDLPPPLAPPAPTATPPSPAGRERPKWKQVLVMIVSGIVLAFGGCGLFLATVSSSSSSDGALATIGGLLFASGLLVLLVGGITAIVYLVTGLLGHRRSTNG